jgi:hypothetical protein
VNPETSIKFRTRPEYIGRGLFVSQSLCWIPLLDTDVYRSEYSTSRRKSSACADSTAQPLVDCSPLFVIVSVWVRRPTSIRRHWLIIPKLFGLLELNQISAVPDIWQIPQPFGQSPAAQQVWVPSLSSCPLDGIHSFGNQRGCVTAPSHTTNPWCNNHGTIR